MFNMVGAWGYNASASPNPDPDPDLDPDPDPDPTLTLTNANMVGARGLNADTLNSDWNPKIETRNPKFKTVY